MLVKESILEKLEQLPENLQVEVLHYSDYLLKCYLQKNQIEEKQPKSKKRGAYGILKGKIWMSEDFDQPLEELKEYME